VVYDHDEPQWNDIGRGKLILFLHQSSLAILPELSNSITGEMRKKMINFAS
jgi:hypothetical protein